MICLCVGTVYTGQGIFLRIVLLPGYHARGGIGLQQGFCHVRRGCHGGAGGLWRNVPVAAQDHTCAGKSQMIDLEGDCK